MTISQKIQRFFLCWVLITATFALVGAYFRFQTIKANLVTAKEVRTEHYTGLLQTTDLKELAAVKSYESMAYRARDAVSIMRMLDSYHMTFERTGQNYKIDADILRAICYVESGGYAQAKSYANCAGIAQFCATTARATGLDVSGKTSALYKNFRAAKDPKTREIRRQKLMKFDERYDPAKAIPAEGQHVATLRKSWGGLDFAIAAFHMGSTHMKGVTDRFIALTGHKPKRWNEVVQVAARNPKSELHRYLYKELKDDSANYYYKVKAAYDAVRFWENNRPVFDAKLAFYKDPKSIGKSYKADDSASIVYMQKIVKHKTSVAQCFGENCAKLSLWLSTFLMVLLAPPFWRLAGPKIKEYMLP